jgi:hypothetical protein
MHLCQTFSWGFCKKIPSRKTKNKKPIALSADPRPEAVFLRKNPVCQEGFFAEFDREPEKPGMAIL